MDIQNKVLFLQSKLKIMSIQKQQFLMELALEKLSVIKKTKDFYNAIDPVQCKWEVKKLQIEYAVIMEELYTLLKAVEVRGTILDNPILNQYATDFQC